MRGEVWGQVTPTRGEARGCWWMWMVVGDEVCLQCGSHRLHRTESTQTAIRLQAKKRMVCYALDPPSSPLSLPHGEGEGAYPCSCYCVRCWGVEQSTLVRLRQFTQHKLLNSHTQHTQQTQNHTLSLSLSQFMRPRGQRLKETLVLGSHGRPAMDQRPPTGPGSKPWTSYLLDHLRALEFFSICYEVTVWVSSLFAAVWG